MAESPETGGAGGAGSPADGNGSRGADAPAADEPATGDAAADPPPAPDPAAEDGDEQEAAGQPRNPMVVYNFHGPVDALGARFGIADERPTRRSTGRVEATEVDRALRYYLGPRPYPAALAMLRDRHLVVLPGDEDTGRRAGAYALLREMTGSAPLTSLSPTYKLAELGRYSFRTGHGYLVADRLAEAAANQEQRFEAEQLLNKLTAAGAFLVVTTSRAATPGWPAEVIKDWDRPDPQELLDHCLDRTPVQLAGPQLAEIRERVTQRPDPQSVVALVDRITADGVDAAIRSSDDGDCQQVRDYFEKASRLRHEVVEVAAVAFAYGLPRRTWERLCARLRDAADAYARGNRAEAPPDDGTLPATRTGRNGGGSLVVDVRDGAGSPRRVGFRSVRVRQEVLDQLADRYGDEVWSPLEEWLRAEVRSADSEVRGALSLGVALHARNEPDEVAGLLQDWAGGTVPERLTASYALSWMCLQDGLAPLALQTATGWAIGAGPVRAWTAAVALGGELGVRYQTDALRWLWYLSLREERVAAPARGSIADLFREADRDPHGASALVRFVHTRLRDEIAAGKIARTRAALRVVVTVLRAARRASEQPVASYLLREQPHTTEALAALWVEAIASAPHRGDAIEALRGTVHGAGDDPAGETAVRSLARAIRASWSEEELQLRLGQLEPAPRNLPPATAEGKLWQTFLEALKETDDQIEDGDGEGDER